MTHTKVITMDGDWYGDRAVLPVEVTRRSWGRGTVAGRRARRRPAAPRPTRVARAHQHAAPSPAAVRPGNPERR
ncbi:hypothetical protein PV703_21820 [Streptomyces sp. ME01-24h]|nr:hypothetical protein [Streptomyces sp. ME19-03-3]MDX3355903.1 hypothetical protein [Streptomyces sp. ME01-24h]